MMMKLPLPKKDSWRAESRSHQAKRKPAKTRLATMITVSLELAKEDAERNRLKSSLF